MDNKQKSNEKCSYTMKEKSEKFAVNFWQLSEKVRMNFDKKFIAKLFDSCGLPLKGLAEKLNISYPFVVHLRRNLYSIPSSIILLLSNMSHIPLLEIQKNITSIRTRAGNSLTIAFPIQENADIAALVGHVFGDGYVGKNKKQFEYSNKNILKYLDHREKASTAEVAQHIQKSKTKALKKLKLLKTKGLVRQIGKIAINRSYVWSIKGGDVTIE